MEMQLTAQLLVVFCWLLLSLQLIAAQLNQGDVSIRRSVIVNGTFGKKYTNSINSSFIIMYQYNHYHTEDSVIRVMTTLKNRTVTNTTDLPLFIVTRQEMTVESWSLPYVMRSEAQFDEVSRYLCCHGQQVNTSLPVTIEANTYSLTDVDLEIRVDQLYNFTISTSTDYNISLTPSYSVYYQYSFKGSKKSVTLIARSPDSNCAIVSVQPAKCPVMDLVENIQTIGSYQTFLQSTAIILDPANGDTQFIVFAVLNSNLLCTNNDKILPIGAKKIKHIQFHVEPHINELSYTYAVIAAVCYGVVFYLSFFLFILINTCREKRRSAEGDETFISEEADRLQPPSRMYGSMGHESLTPNDNDASARELEENGGDGDSRRPRTVSETSRITDADYLDDINDIREVRRIKVEASVADLAQKKDKSLNNKYSLYHWNLVTIAIFYALPVAQLVFTYQKYLNVSGNQDICYYNFLCSRPFGPFHNFNNVLSNIGYLLLGVLFILVTYRRQRFIKSLKDDVRENCGIPPHLGLFYAMGWALIVEGIMSACYHVCPSYTNFQFDTSFMYILGGLMLLRLYQSRHPDVNVNAHVAYLSLAAIIALALIGVLLNTPEFWAVFSALYIIFILIISLQIYYVGQFKFGRSMLTDLKWYCTTNFCRVFKPTSVSRFVLISLMNIMNWGLALYGVIKQPSDFASHLLMIIIVNLTIYCVFYCIMKLLKKEKISISSYIFAALAVIIWGFALYFFLNGLTSWQLTPAQSRDLNHKCILLDFFDGHDVWHFLSAAAMFCSFLVIFHMDDDLMYTPRSKIPAF